MSAITLAQAERIIDAIIERGAALDCRPPSAIVVGPLPSLPRKRGREGRG